MKGEGRVKSPVCRGAKQVVVQVVANAKNQGAFGAVIQLTTRDEDKVLLPGAPS